MNRSDLARHLKHHGCILAREGAKHEIWENSDASRTVAVPQHNPIKRNRARRICKDLKIPLPPALR